MNEKQAGFTVVELLVTVLVAALFIAMFYQLYTTLVQLNSTARRDASASDVAFSNLRKYASASTTGVTCPGASSTQIYNLSGVDGNYPELGSVTETVTVSCPNSTSVNLVESEVTYNNGTSKASYATYVN